ncbi:MAG: phosphatase PAP2 family protein [Bacteroidetes bacterium]|nr:phosphatase PAP2 family protein [Bacteroidota bacterium]
MIKRDKSVNFWITLTVIVSFAIYVSMKYLDTVIAIRVMRFLLSIKTLHKAAENIPDILAYLVGAGTILMWVIYIYRTYKKKFDIKTKFLLLAATTLPTAYVLKFFLQYAFGRTTPRFWLIANKPLVFHLFHEIGNGCFPSGHMTVFTAFGAAVLIYYPQFRTIVYVMLALLGAALIVTDYHFLSDVIAGCYLGFITTYALWFLFEKRRAKP